MTDIRVGLATDAGRYRATDELVWFEEVLSADTDTVLAGLPADQRFAAEIDGDGEADAAAYAGIYGVFPLELAVPAPRDTARLIPCAGLTWVGVHPDRRRRGVLTAMLRHHFEQVRGTPGTHVSALHASEPGIYGRHGYGLASLQLEVTLGRGTTLTAPGLDDAASAVTVRLGSTTEPGTAARLRECHRATAGAGAGAVGAVVGEVGYYERILRQFPETLRGKEPWRLLYARRDGRDVGFTIFRRNEKWEHARPAGELEVWTIVGDPAARLALLRRLLDFDLVTTVKVSAVGTDDPLIAWAGGPRATTSVQTYDNLWIRLVDLPEALAERAWSAPCDVVVEVADRAAPWNDGRWRLHADADGVAVAERTTAEADLRLSVDALGAAYLGGTSLVALAEAGLVTESRAGAVLELGRALRTDLAPSAAVGF